MVRTTRSFQMALIFGLEPKTVLISANATLMAQDFVCHFYKWHFLTKTTKLAVSLPSVAECQCYEVFAQFIERRIKQKTVLLDGFLFYGSPFWT